MTKATIMCRRGHGFFRGGLFETMIMPTILTSPSSEHDTLLLHKIRKQGTEQWKEFQPGLKVSNMGRIQLPSGKVVLASEVTEKGYRRIAYKGKKLKVHRLVAMCFVENPEGYKYVTHLDGDKSNNKANNLKWVERPMRRQ